VTLSRPGRHIFDSLAGASVERVRPYDRLLYASVNSAATQVTGNSIVTIDPLTGAIGKAVTVGSQPSSIALSDDGQALYSTLTGSNQIALYRPLSHSLAFSFAPPNPTYSTGANHPRGIAVMPGTENTIAIDEGSFQGLGIFDIDPTSQAITLRGTALSGPIQPPVPRSWTQPTFFPSTPIPVAPLLTTSSSTSADSPASTHPLHTRARFLALEGSPYHRVSRSTPALHSPMQVASPIPQPRRLPKSVSTSP
jgi:6-phosphogluconolactonase (cycloisomerase 2 family)